MVLTASEQIRRALRLINVPGRGSSLGSADLDDGFEALQEILDSEAVSKAFVPGIRRHFFSMQQGKAIYSYGVGPQADLRSDDFDDDPAPIRIEDAYIREGSAITDNELVGEYRFENVGSWVVDVDPAAQITNNQYVVEAPAAATSTTQSVNAVSGATYTLRANVEVINGTVEISLRDSAVAFETFILDATGLFDFDFVWGGVVAPDIEIATTTTNADVKINTLSVIERGKDRLELPDSRGSDHSIELITQRRYNRRFSKGTGGRPYEILYSRDFPLSEIRFDNSAIAGDILVLDVLVNRVMVNRLEDPIRMHPSATKWLRYALADALSGEYGTELTMRQGIIMSDAWNKLSTGNRRMNHLVVDRGLRTRPTFDINRGDP